MISLSHAALRCVVGAAIALVASPADANDYTAAGVVELGGALGFSRSTYTMEIDGVSSSDNDSTSTELSVEPSVAYFVSRGVQLRGRVLIHHRSADSADGGETSTSFGLSIGGGYFLPAGAAYVGPFLDLALLHNTVDNGIDVSQSGFGVTAGAALKIPIADGALIELSARYAFVKLDGEVTYGSSNTDTSVSDSGVSLLGGVSVFFDS